MSQLFACALDVLQGSSGTIAVLSFIHLAKYSGFTGSSSMDSKFL
jgi:hypothetical protein